MYVYTFLRIKKIEIIIKTMGKACFHSIPEIGSEFLATGILPTLSLECDYIFRFPEFAEKQVLCNVLVLFGLFMLSEAYPELLDVTRLPRHLRGSTDSPFCPGGLDRLNKFRG